MREIHEIREKLYKEMKDMAPGEYAVRVNREIKELAKKCGLKTLMLADTAAK